DTLTFPRARIVNDIAFLELAAVNAEKHQLANVRISPKFKSEGTELRIIIRSHFDLLQAIGCDALRRGNIQRRRKIIDNGVHEGLHAALFESGPAQHRDEFDLTGKPADGSLEDLRCN